ncbi:hypothetical protein KR093_005824 [Drosophila rubida]|uniref:Uncharacterized protein n=1 Tax=Drosophila rubida TaxID=30044 RepID=A0AAD4JV87_9MUSC|nr:hypothetical protein KR093_005824 [Drosophila rubida]
MLSKMAQSNNVGAGGTGPAVGGRRVPLSLSGSGSGSVSRLQQAATGSNGRSNSPQNKKNEQAANANGPFVATKKVKEQSSSSSSSTSNSTNSKDKEKKNQNGVTKSTNGNQKTSQNGGSSNAVAKEQQKKEKHAEKQREKELNKVESKEDVQPIVKEPEAEVKVVPPTVNAVEPKKQNNKEPAAEIIEVDDEPEVAIVVVEPTTPTSERKSSRKLNQQKTPNKAEQIEASPEQKKRPEATIAKPAAEPVEDVEMETLAVEASPIRSEPVSHPAATSTPGRNLFGFRSNCKQTKEVELAAQPSSSPAAIPTRSFAQITGRRSIRPETALTPGKLGNYRCINTSELDASNCTNTSMNATVGSEIPNSSSFSFSFFGRGRKRERTPPALSGSQSTTDLGQDVEMSPPKRARFELFSMNLASPFSMLRSRFSKATISSPSTRPRLDDTPPAGEEEETENGGEVQNVSGIVIQEEEQQQLNKSSASAEVAMAQEAGLDTPKKGGSPVKEAAEDNKDVDLNDKSVEGDEIVANVPIAEVEGSTTEVEGANRSRCAIM